MFAPPKKRTGDQPPKKRHGAEKKVDVKALVKDLSNSYRQLDDYVLKENEDKKKWNQHSPDNIMSKQRNESTAEKHEKQSIKKISSFTSDALDSSTAKNSPRKSENIYADDDGMERTIDRTPIPEDMHSLLDAYPKKFHELRQIMEEMKERHTKSINRMRQKLKKDALKHEEEVKEAAKRDAQAESDKLRHLLKLQRAKSQRVMESMKLEKQKLINSQAKSNKSLRQTENKLADMQKGLYTLKKQLGRSQREKTVSEQGRVEQRSKAVKQKKRADELQRDIKSLESGIETVRLLNRQNENITQHDYDVLHWKYCSIVKLVREVESIATPPDLGKIPSLQAIMEARNGRGSRVRLPAIGYPRRLPIKGEQRAFNGRERRLIVYPQKQVVHQIPRRNNQNETKFKPNKEGTLALPMPQKKLDDSRGSSSTSTSTSSNRSHSGTSRRSERKNGNDRDKSDDYGSDFESDNASDTMLALPMPETRPEESRRSSSTRRSRSDSPSTSQKHSGASQKSEKKDHSRVQSAASDDEKESSDNLASDVAADNMDAKQKMRSENESQEGQDADKKDKQDEDAGVFLT